MLAKMSSSPTLVTGSHGSQCATQTFASEQPCAGSCLSRLPPTWGQDSYLLGSHAAHMLGQGCVSFKNMNSFPSLQRNVK